jgi:hypothetical protein
MRPNSYKLAKCCGTCKYAIFIYYKDDPEETLCNHDGSKVPLDPVEINVIKNQSIRKERYDEWYKWSIPRQIEECGVCHLYQMNEDLE